MTFTLASVYEQFLDEAKNLRRPRPHTLRAYCYKLAAAVQAPQFQIALDRITLNDLETWLARGQASAGTIGRRASAVGRAHETAAIPCPFNACGVKLAFETYVLGNKSDSDIAWLLNDAGYRTTGVHGTNPFSKDSMKEILRNRFYIGQTHYKGEWIEGNHSPLISADLFERCQNVRRERSRYSRNPHNISACYPLGSLLVCAECESNLRGWFLKGERRYRDPANG